jgi:hypothetical protein
MAGPWHPMVPGVPGRGRLRASDADREQVIDTLKAAYVYGLLAKDELDLRAGRALASRTYAELAALTAGIPPGLVGTWPPPPVAQPRSRKLVSKKAAAWAACLLVVAPALGAAFFTFYGGFLVLFLFAFIGATVTAQP